MRERVCKNCGGKEYKVVGQNMVKCAFCGTLYVDEHASKEEEVLLVGAYEILRSLRFDDAVDEFDKILTLYPLSFEAYFGKALAKNKIILYTNKKGTSKRPRFFGGMVSILEDEDFKKAISLAPEERKADYEKTVNRIERIKNTYNEKTSKLSYDVVICGEQSELSSKTVEELTKNGISVYAMPPREKEEETFRAFETCKALIFFAQKGNFYAEFKHVFDRYIYFISQRKKARTSFVLATDEMAKLPRNLAFCKSVIDINSISFLQDVCILIKNEMKNFVGETAKIETIKVDKADLKKKEYVDIESVTPTELGHYQVENVALSTENKIKWIFLTLKNGDFASAQELVDKELENDPYNSELLFAKLMTEKKIKTQEEFFSSIFNFTDKERIENILRYASKDFAEKFVDKWEELIIDLGEEEYFLAFLTYLAGYKTPNREKFIQKAEEIAVETLDEALIEKVLKCFDKNEVDRFVNFYFLLAQKSDDDKYYQKILELDEGHFQSNLAILMHHFKTTDDILTYRNKEEFEDILKFFDDEKRAQLISAIISQILPIAFNDVDEAEAQLDFYLAYCPTNETLAELSQKVAIDFQQQRFFKQAEKYLAIAISNNKENCELYWLLIQIKSHCASENELITSGIKITQFPEWETLLEYADEKHDEIYAKLASKASLYSNADTSSLRPELLDKKRLVEKVKEFLARNDKVLLEIEKQEGMNAKIGVDYFRAQLKPFEKYIQEANKAEAFDVYCDVVKKVDERLEMLNLTLEMSVSVISIEKRCGVLQKHTEIENEKSKKVAKKLKNDKFLKFFACVFFEIFPLMFSVILLLEVVVSPKEIYLQFSQEFLICTFVYSTAVALINLMLYVIRKNKTTKEMRLAIVSIVLLGAINMLLFCVGFYFAPRTIEIKSAHELQVLLPNAKYSSFKLTSDIDFDGKNWKNCDFYGNFDGNGHKIYNISLSKGGLFDANSGEIVNLELSTTTNLSGVKTFGVVANSNSGKIENCTTSGTLNVEIGNGGTFGGMVGQNVNGSVIACKSALEIVVSVEAEACKIGGLIGEIEGGETYQNSVLGRLEISLLNCKTAYVGGLTADLKHSGAEISQNAVEIEMTIDGEADKIFVGGLVGYGEQSSHDNRTAGSISTGEMTGEGFVGGLYGVYSNTNSSNAINHSYSTIEVDTHYVTGSLVGQLGGRIDCCYGVSGEKTSGEILQYCGENNCANLTETFYDESFGFDKNIWKIFSDAYPKLLWETEEN